MTKTPQPKRNYIRAETKNLQRLLDAGVSRSDIAKELGVSLSSVTTWTNAGEMPKTAAIACEALLRRTGQGKAFSQEFALITFDRANCAQVKNVLRAIGVEFYKLDTSQKGD